ncbi:hypothetical protein WESB_0348 [Brachyspira pilosicoli WesB]|uniref:Uncharacterized protein n=1 Tax=Brachyspira pilosicoli WesB TaxID=1161918 RepID=K0JGC3_BRAPL|nr:hypothetical protein [Brachyspira pilosicoli]CCG55819.1 hypothetical protein WESB_0348 [Brachyspira pilosicoli WesB]
MNFLKTNRLTIILIFIIISYIFYNDFMNNNNNNNTINNIYNANYIVTDNNIILENNYDFNSTIEIKEIRRNYLRWRDREHPKVDFEEDSKDLYVRLIIIFMIGAAILGVLIEILFFKKDSYKYYIIVLAIIFIISSIIIYKIHENLAIFNIGGSIESILELSAFFFGGVISFIVLLISKHLRDKDNKKNNK